VEGGNRKAFSGTFGYYWQDEMWCVQISNCTWYNTSTAKDVPIVNGKERRSDQDDQSSSRKRLHRALQADRLAFAYPFDI
jgi:hypothetical protein